MADCRRNDDCEAPNNRADLKEVEDKLDWWSIVDFPALIRVPNFWINLLGSHVADKTNVEPQNELR